MASVSFLGFNPVGVGQPQQQQHHHHHDQDSRAASPPPIGSHAGPAVHQQHQPPPSQGAATAEIRRITREYNSEAARLAEQLSLCGIQQAGLTEEAQAPLQLLAQVAGALQLAAAKPQLVLAAWALLLVQESKATRLQHALQRELAVLAQQRAKARAKAAVLAKVLADVTARQGKEAGRAHDKAKLTEQMRHKDEGYQAMLTKTARRLEHNGFTPEITHAALLVQHARLQDAQQRLADLQAQLAGYHELPATLLGARMRLQGARAQLEDTHERFQVQLAGDVCGQ